MKQCQQVPELLYKTENSEKTLIFDRIVDEIKTAGVGDQLKCALKEFIKKFTLGTVKSGPGNLRCFSTNTSQDADMTVSTNADDKLNALTEHKMSRTRRKEIEKDVHAIEKAFYASTNSLLGWIGTEASPLGSFYATYLKTRRHLIPRYPI